MRYRLMYLLSFVLSAVTIYNFSDNTKVMAIFGILSRYFIIFGVVMSFFFIFLTNTGAVAALRRSKQYASTIGKSFLWTFFSAILCLALVYLANYFVSTSSFEINNSSLIYERQYSVLTGENRFVLSGFQQLTFLGLLAFITFSFLFGYYLKPDLRIIRPAYTVMNSIAEVGFRFMGTVCNIYIVLLFFISGNFFAQALHSNILKNCFPLLRDLSILTAIIVFAVLPLLYAIFTRFKENPIPVMWSALITSIISVFTKNIYFTIPVMEVIHRRENNSMKKTVVTSGNILFLFNRLGCMVIAYLTILSLLRDAELSLTVQLLVPVVCLIASLICGIYPGTEVLFIVSVITVLFGEDIDSGMLSLVGVLTPLLNAFGLFIDTFAVNLGTNALDMPAQNLEALILK